MISIPPRFEWHQPPRRRRRDVVKWLAFAAALLVVFALGIALGEALHDSPNPHGTVTFVRTIRP